MSRTRFAVGVGALALVLAGCGTSGGSDTSSAPGQKGFQPPDVPMQKSIGKGEGAVDILAWPGYAEDGSNDKTVDWVTPFEKQTGCQAKVKYFGTSDEAVSLMKTGDYDVVSASGDASLRLIAGGNVAPFNTKLTPSYADVAPFLKDRDWNSVDKQMYGIPHGWGANLLMYNTKTVKPAPTTWAVGVRRRVDVQGQGDGVRLADLHRRRGAVPDADQARAEDQGPLRAGQEAARRGGRGAQEAARRTSGSTGRTTPRRSAPSRPARPSSAPPGR